VIEKEYAVTFGDGVFKELFLKFIQYKKGIGFKYGREVESALSKLNNKLNAYHMETLQLPKEIVEKLAERIPSEASATQAKRIGFLRHFAIFLNNMGHEAYVYPQLYNVKSNSSFSPYIFSYEQISAIVSASDSLGCSAKSPKHHIVWPAFVRVLYGCGLRLSEALRLQTKDIDLKNGVLYIEKSKKNTSRYVPMSKSLMQYCINYAVRMKLDMDNNGYFFPAPDNGKYGINTARYAIKKL
jgi:integrase